MFGKQATHFVNEMIAVQLMPCRQMETVFTAQPSSLNVCDSVNENRTIPDSDVLDQTSAVYFKYLIKKYRRHTGYQDVCSGGLQQFLIKQKEKKQREMSDKEITGQEQSLFEQLPVSQ